MRSSGATLLLLVSTRRVFYKRSREDFSETPLDSEMDRIFHSLIPMNGKGNGLGKQSKVYSLLSKGKDGKTLFDSIHLYQDVCEVIEMRDLFSTSEFS
jgi:hypothetical protein